MMKKIVPGAVFLLILSLAAAAAERPAPEMHFLDVGCGDAILLKSPAGNYSLIDTGSPRAKEKLFDYLKNRGVEKLAYLIVTHPHPDHLGNAAAVLAEFRAEKLRDNGEEIDRFDEHLTPEMAEEYEREFRGGEDYSVLRAGDRIEWEGVVIDVLWPPDLISSDDWNTNSLVLMVRHGEFRALLAGDFNTAGEEIILREGTVKLGADLLKVGHHGAGDATGDDFLRAVSPRAAVVSVGENPWGYPDEARLARLEETGIRIFRTDRDGTVVFRCREDGTFARYPPAGAK